MKLRPGIRVMRTERERDDAIRRVQCPNCSAPPPYACIDVRDDGTDYRMATGHTGRYLAAVEAGLVPPLVGWPWTS